MAAGVDKAPGDLSAAALISKLRAIYNPNKRVELIILQLGSAGNFTALQQIATAGRGQAYQISDPPQIRQGFFAAFPPPTCPGAGRRALPASGRHPSRFYPLHA